MPCRVFFKGYTSLIPYEEPGVLGLKGPEAALKILALGLEGFGLGCIPLILTVLNGGLSSQLRTKGGNFPSIGPCGLPLFPWDPRPRKLRTSSGSWVAGKSQKSGREALNPNETLNPKMVGLPCDIASITLWRDALRAGTAA